MEILYDFEGVFVCDTSHTKNELELQPADMDSGLARTIEWHRDTQIR